MEKGGPAPPFFFARRHTTVTILCYRGSMDDSVTQPDRQSHRDAVRRQVKRITPPSESNTSTVLNGIGNGMMVGTAPFIAMGIHDQITKGNLSARFSVINAIAVAVGSIVGGWLGLREAQRLSQYRNDLGEEIVSLRTQANDTDARLKTWEQRMEKHETAAHTASEKTR